MREAVVNAAKHSGCAQIDVFLERQGGWNVLYVRDDGGGMRPPSGDAGFGLPGMEYRARLLGGELRIEAVAPRGTQVTLRWPAAPPR
jgi:signal transduction histidine kinase